jgi:hypothetical protein
MLELMLYAPLVLNRILVAAPGSPDVNLTIATGCLEALMLIAALWHFYDDK